MADLQFVLSCWDRSLLEISNKIETAEVKTRRKRRGIVRKYQVYLLIFFYNFTLPFKINQKEAVAGRPTQLDSIYGEWLQVWNDLRRRKTPSCKLVIYWPSTRHLTTPNHKSNVTSKFDAFAFKWLGTRFGNTIW